MAGDHPSEVSDLRVALDGANARIAELEAKVKQLESELQDYQVMNQQKDMQIEQLEVTASSLQQRKK